MYLKKFEYYILDSSVAGTLLLIALAIRIEAVNAGFDQFSSNIIFISVFIISTGLYIIHKTKCFDFLKRSVYFPKRNVLFFTSPTLFSTTNYR
ncbi:hypothetical protein DW889_16260 [Bacteroides stercoris]|uniref:Uncharacterized protein n=1 Tax=Bacteroides stercoris TaxID=46506 RepID=A0A413UUT2_BACSE|nr:hypothetical protein DW889_16260 [Bacteroides stercoris]